MCAALSTDTSQSCRHWTEVQQEVEAAEAQDRVLDEAPITLLGQIMCSHAITKGVP